MNNDCVTVDELLLEIADYKNNDQEMAAEQLKRLCSTSYEAYQYLQDCAHDAWLPERARFHIRNVLVDSRITLHAFQEYGRAYPDCIAGCDSRGKKLATRDGVRKYYHNKE